MDTTPDAYKVGWIEFFGKKFWVTPDVLIPRPETTMLIDAVWKLSRTSPSDKVSIIDVGTGSGILAVTLAGLFPYAQVIAIDISKAALAVARKNAKLHKVATKITFLKSDLLTDIKEQVDIIVANLPYIPSARIATLDPSVKDHEPHLALDGGPDGFSYYERLFGQIRDRNLTPSYFFGEIDDTQGELARARCHFFFPTARAHITKDFWGRNRLLTIVF